MKIANLCSEGIRVFHSGLSRIDGSRRAFKSAIFIFHFSLFNSLPLPLLPRHLQHIINRRYGDWMIGGGDGFACTGEATASEAAAGTAAYRSCTNFKKCSHSWVVHFAAGMLVAGISRLSQRWASASTFAKADDVGLGALAGRPGLLIHSS